MTNTALSAEDRLLNLFRCILKIALGRNPLEDSGMTLPQLTLLDWIAASPGSSVSEIADGLDLTAPTVSVGVRRLEEVGLLERQPNPDDGRSIRLFLTVKGRALQERALAFRREKMKELLGGLTSEEAATLLTLMEKAMDAAVDAGHVEACQSS